MSTEKFIVNSYNKEVCTQLVKKKYEHLIKQKFGKYTHLCFDSLYTWVDVHNQTPRLRAVTGQIPCATFYYTEFLVNINPDTIYDIGCGMNFFKGILPNVIGIDADGNAATHSEYDIKDVFDAEFVVGHENQFQAVMSIDALHFTSITNFTKRVLDFARVIKPGGRGYIAMNAARLIDFTPKKDLIELFGTDKRDANLISQYIDSEIRKLLLNFLVVDNLVNEKLDDCMDGNIRLVIQK
jgi:hypothetical protein